MRWIASFRTADWLRVLNWAALGAIGILIFAGDSGGDAHAYWAARGYSGIADERDAFLYTPAFLQAIAPVQFLPWEVFRLLWLTAGLATLAWLTGPAIALLVLLPGPYSPVYTDLWFGNVMVFTAALTVAGFTKPGAWAVLPFAKLFPAVVLLWPLARRWWGPLLLAGAIAVLSVAIAPGLWAEWARTLTASAARPPTSGLSAWLIPRTLVASGVVLIGAWRSWRWTLPTAVLLTQPVLWFSSFTILLGWVWLLRNRTPSVLDAPDRTSPGCRASADRAANR